jgi:DNA-directed RNA polymerase specialized sigma24 family protein
MSNPEPNPGWVLSNSQRFGNDEELRATANRLWPRIQLHVRRKFSSKNPEEGTALATEVWEAALLSISKTLQRKNRPVVVDLEAYLFGVFLHRFSRAMRRERRREQVFETRASTAELEQLSGGQDWKSATDMERSVQVQEVVENMDAWTKSVFAARVYGYSWRDIAKVEGMEEGQARLRFRYALRKLAARLGYQK